MSMWQQLEATIAESVGATMDARGRGFASATEAWGEIKKTLDSAKKAQAELGKLHDETWQQIITKNEDGITAMLREFYRAAANQAANLVQLAAMSKIAMELTDE